MTRRTAIEIAGVLLAVVVIAVVATREGGFLDQPDSDSQRGATQQGGEDGKGSANADGEADGDPSAPEAKAERAARRTEQRVSTNTFASEKVLEIFGLEGRVRVSDDGRVVTVIVARRSACKAVPADEARIKKFLRDAVPSIRRVVVKVEGTDQSLRSYVLANCKRTKFPGGPGQTVFWQRGDGFDKSKRFRIRGPKWAIDYQAMGNSLFMLVSKKGKGVIAPGIGQRNRGTGSQDYKGKGVYRIDIRGSGFWKVRVRDGA